MGKNPNQRFGSATIKADGGNTGLKDVSFVLPGVRRDDLEEGKAFSETEVGGWAKGKINLQSGQSVKSINEMDDVTLIINADTSQTYVCPHAWCTNPLEVSKDGAEAEFKFAEAEEMVNG